MRRNDLYFDVVIFDVCRASISYVLRKKKIIIFFLLFRILMLKRKYFNVQDPASSTLKHSESTMDRLGTFITLTSPSEIIFLSRLLI